LGGKNRASRDRHDGEVVERGFPTRQKCRVNEPRLGVVCRGLLEMFATGAATGPLMVSVHLPDPYIVVRLLPFHDLPFVPSLNLRLGPPVANSHPHDLQKPLNIKIKIIIQRIRDVYPGS
jgi:hypothetical protein